MSWTARWQTAWLLGAKHMYATGSISEFIWLLCNLGLNTMQLSTRICSTRIKLQERVLQWEYDKKDHGNPAAKQLNHPHWLLHAIHNHWTREILSGEKLNNLVLVYSQKTQGSLVSSSLNPTNEKWKTTWYNIVFPLPPPMDLHTKPSGRGLCECTLW